MWTGLGTRGWRDTQSFAGSCLHSVFYLQKKRRCPGVPIFSCTISANHCHSRIVPRMQSMLRMSLSISIENKAKTLFARSSGSWLRAVLSVLLCRISTTSLANTWAPALLVNSRLRKMLFHLGTYSMSGCLCVGPHLQDETL